MLQANEFSFFSWVWVNWYHLESFHSCHKGSVPDSLSRSVLATHVFGCVGEKICKNSFSTLKDRQTGGFIKISFCFGICQVTPVFFFYSTPVSAGTILVSFVIVV